MAKKKGSKKFTVAPAQTSPSLRQRRRIIIAVLSLAALILTLVVFQPALRQFRQTRRADVPVAPFVVNKGARVFPPAAPTAKPDEPDFEDFVGSETCAPCHAEQYEVWRRSTHGRAGGRPSPQNVIGTFDGKARRYQDGEVIPAVKAGQHYTFTVKQPGLPDVVINVAAVIGGGHLYGGGTQSYFAEWPDGTLRFLPFDYSRHNKTWFSQLRSNLAWAPVNPGAALTALQEWPPARVLGTVRDLSNCQNCHASQLLTQYDFTQRRYVTRYKSLDINCESCHGPGKRHVELAQAERASEIADLGMTALATLSKDESLQICWQCHAVKNELDAPYLPGKNFANYYSVKLSILADNPHLADGRIRAFAYQQNHLYSDCYLNGSMTCVDCHDPHSQKYRDINGRELASRFDNRQCLACHASKAKDLSAHTHHPDHSAGSACVACHMPYLQHRGIGAQIQFARADHSIAIPRPEVDAKLGLESACQQCHAQKAVAWLEQKTQAWYGLRKPHKPLVTGLLQAETTTDRLIAAKLLLQPGANHPMAQYASLSYFIKQFLQPDMPNLETEIVEKLQALCREPDADLQALALMSLHWALGQQAEIHSFLLEALKNSSAQELTLRARWALALDYLGTRYVEKGDYAKAIVAHQKGLEINPNDPITWMNLGIAYGSQGDFAKAKSAFTDALALDATNAKVYINLAAVYSRQQDPAPATAAYQQALRLQPHDPATHILLAQLHLQNGQVEEAKTVLKTGITRAPYDYEIKRLLQQLESVQEN